MYFYILFVEVVLLLGFLLLLLLLGANPSSSFTQWAYRNLDRTMEPFRGIFAPIELGTAGNDVLAVFETSVLFAMVVYGVVAMTLGAVIGWLSNQISRIQRAEAMEQAQAHAESIAFTQAQPRTQPAPNPEARSSRPVGQEPP